MNSARLVFIVTLLLSLFIAAKSFIAVSNVDQWSDDLRRMFMMELGQVGKRSYPINYYMDRIDQIQTQWTIMRYVSIGLVACCCYGIFLVSRNPRTSRSKIAQPSAPPNGGPATPPGNSGVTEGPPSVS
ncbi:MAG TPA: hypothetical protein PKC18_08050 [Lacipirellulaceae bacterium]|nr:hypothetical protein [Verrucomicrobiota bacterium]HMO84855.1 hypothetical protein [Lacipirellulaceae bacterium]